MAYSIITLLRDAVLGKQEIAQSLGKSKPSRYLNELARKMLDVGLIEMTIPEKANSRLQKYRLTEKGRAVLAGLNGSKAS